MKIRDLLDYIKKQRKKHGKEFLEFDIYAEQITQRDKKCKRGPQKWAIIKDSEGWEYFKCEGFWTEFPGKKIFTINVNY